MDLVEPIHLGTIQLTNVAQRYGIIVDEDLKTKVFFTFDAVEVGYPVPGAAVHFVPDQTSGGPIARRIVVLSAVARGQTSAAV